MFAFIRRLFRSSVDPRVFPYHDGTNWRSADPLEIERAFVDRLGDKWRDKVIKLDKDPVPFGTIGAEAKKLREDHRKLGDAILEAIDAAFGVESYRDGKGLTIAKRHALLEAYNRFCIELIAIARPFVKPQSRASPSRENPPISNGADSSSVASG